MPDYQMAIESTKELLTKADLDLLG